MLLFRHSLAKMKIVMLECTAIAFHGSLVDVRYARTFSFPHCNSVRTTKIVLKITCAYRSSSSMKRILVYLEKINNIK